VVSVCIAIDDSGSICDGDNVCQAFQDGQSFAQEILQGINDVVTSPKYSVVMFSTSATRIQTLTTDVSLAEGAIDDYVYTGQCPNT